MDENNQRLAAELGRYKSIEELRRSDAFRRHQATLDQLFNAPRTYLQQTARPRLKSFLRVAAWNIECGKRLDGIIEALNTHPILRFADLILLSEVDDGMARSANRSGAFELGRKIGAHAIYGIEYLELSSPELADPIHHDGNTAALAGNAILTRHRFRSPRLLRLPRCENNFKSPQKRLGGRIGLAIDLDLGSTGLVAATTHLDVVNTPRCRQKQLRAFLRYLDTAHRLPAILGGDFNTHTFSRGTRIRALRNLYRLLANPDEVAGSLLKPVRFEPLLRDLETFGFRLQEYNDKCYTCRVDDAELLQSSGLPGPLKRLIRRRFGSAPQSLDFRLDWLAGRYLKGLGDGEAVDAVTGVHSISARTIAGLEYRGCPVSDHNPIVADIQATPVS